MPGAWDGFELGVRAILGQQVTVAGATTLSGRLVREFGTRLPEPAGGLTHLFPPAARLAEAGLAKLGLPGSRAKALRTFSQEVAAGNLSLSPAASMEEARAGLLAIPGLGPWTVEYIAMRALRDPDAFPAGDLWLRRALSPGGAVISEAGLRARAEEWRPWRAYAAVHLWTALASTGAGSTAPKSKARASTAPTPVTSRPAGPARKTPASRARRKSHARSS